MGGFLSEWSEITFILGTLNIGFPGFSDVMNSSTPSRSAAQRFSASAAAIHLIGSVVSLRSRAAQSPRSKVGSEQVSVPTIDTFGCARFHPFGNGKPQKRAGPATRERRKPWRRQAPPFPESVIHRELAFQAQIPRPIRQRALADQLRRGVLNSPVKNHGYDARPLLALPGAPQSIHILPSDNSAPT